MTVDPASVRDAIAAAREETELRADLDAYRRNVRVGRVERDPAHEDRLEAAIAAAERRQRLTPDEPRGTNRP